MLTISTISQDLVNTMDLSALESFISTSKNKQYFNMESGKEHYRLIAYLASLLENKRFVDIGTFHGFSALALSFDKDATVTTYDIIDCIADPAVKSKENITFKLMDCVNDMDLITQSDFIVLDIDPHDGKEEVRILEALEKKGYKGMVLLDDIHLNAQMDAFWNSITHKKVDLTKYGHWSGTGLVIFDSSRFDFSF